MKNVLKIMTKHLKTMTLAFLKIMNLVRHVLIVFLYLYFEILSQNYLIIISLERPSSFCPMIHCHIIQTHKKIQAYNTCTHVLKHFLAAVKASRASSSGSAEAGCVERAPVSGRSHGNRNVPTDTLQQVETRVAIYTCQYQTDQRGKYNLSVTRKLHKVCKYVGVLFYLQSVVGV